MYRKYWKQWSSEEIKSMQDIDVDDPIDQEVDYLDTDERIDNDQCHKCVGGGCNYCLMVGW